MEQIDRTLSSPDVRSRERLKGLFERKLYSEAAAFAHDMLRSDGDKPDLWNLAGNAHRFAGDFYAAAQCYRAAISASPRFYLAWSNLGLALEALGLHKAARRMLEHAIELGPHDSNMKLNYAIALSRMGEDQHAIAVFDAFGPQPPSSVVFDRGTCHLRLGNLAEGWPGYETRLDPTLKLVSAAPVGARRWKGEPIKTERLLVRCEQGYGDQIWASRFLAKAKDLVGELIVEAPRELLRLYKGMGIDLLVERGKALPECRWFAHICSLPSFFVDHTADIPSSPYISKDPPSREFCRAEGAADLIGSAKAPLKVGIVWSGNPNFPANQARSVSFREIAAGLVSPGIQLYSLQKGNAVWDVLSHGPNIWAGGSIISLGPLLDDFEETRQAVAMLDLMIMTDSAVAHLAGAMGKPVWLMVGPTPYWLWGKSSKSSVWYPSVRIFRSSEIGCWSVPIDEIASELHRLAHPTPA